MYIKQGQRFRRDSPKNITVASEKHRATKIAPSRYIKLKLSLPLLLLTRFSFRFKILTGYEPWKCLLSKKLKSKALIFLPSPEVKGISTHYICARILRNMVLLLLIIIIIIMLPYTTKGLDVLARQSTVYTNPELRLPLRSLQFFSLSVQKYPPD